MSESPLLDQVYRIFDPAPLRANQDDLYIDLDEARGHADIVNRLAQRIRLADKPTCQLLAGHRGSGKSTELYRLQRELQRTESQKRYFVVFCECDEDVDRNDLDFPDVLIAVVRQTAQQLKARAGITLQPGYFKDRWERLKSVLGSEINLDEFELDTGLLKLSGAIKSSPEARGEIRKLLEPDTSHLIDAANDIISQAILSLQQKAYQGLVILVDDLDKMVLRPHGAGCSTGEYLFVHREAQLSAFDCHMVYTLPLGLAYSVQERVVASLYGGTVPVVPMIKISTPPPTSQLYEPGFRKLRDLIDARLAKVATTRHQVFTSDAVRDSLIRQSGGQPRELMILIRESLISAGLPITPTAVDRAVREGRRAYERQLREEHWPVLREVAQSGKLRHTQDNDELIRDLLDSRAVLQYVNNSEWYGVNPLLAESLRTT